jgi:hypothetical protein
MVANLEQLLNELHLEQKLLAEELRAERIPSRPTPPLLPRTAEQQAEARHIAYEESLAYERDHPFRKPARLRSVS